ncbi:FG-GAP repeat protein [Oceanospirillaceae bacterium]|nr:FG-GAP repeat protein [Oceanospirillaceae bacterium]
MQANIRFKILTIVTFGFVLLSCGGSTTLITAVPAIAAASTLSFGSNKIFRFTWSDVADATYYQLMENPDGASGFTQVGSNIVQGNGVANHIVPLHARVSAQYILKSCNSFGCTSSSTLSVSSTMTNSIAYLKASNTGLNDWFGDVLDVSSDGNTLAVGAPREDSSLTGVNSTATDTTINDSGAVYVFTKSNNVWQQEAYIKASNTGADDHFGSSISLSGDGKTLVVGAENEDGNSDAKSNSGAVYVFYKATSSWAQQAYLKPTYSDNDDQFGAFGALDISDNGNIVAVGAIYEDSGETEFTGTGTGNNNTSVDAGAVYIFTRSSSVWQQTQYIKADNTGAGDNFGKLSLSGDGLTLVVSAFNEDSSSTGINSTENNSATDAGAMYVFVYDGTNWTQEAYIKASNAEADDEFGGDESLLISQDGLTIAVAAGGEDSNALGLSDVNTEGADNSSQSSSAVYVFRKESGTWSQEAYIKSDHDNDNDNLFGGKRGLALNKTGTSLAIGTIWNSSSNLGVSSDSNNSGSLTQAGAVYFFTKSGSSWAKTSFLKAPNTGSSDQFSVSIAMDETGATMVVGAAKESSNATGVAGTGQANNGISGAGAVYVY